MCRYNQAPRPRLGAIPKGTPASEGRVRLLISVAASCLVPPPNPVSFLPLPRAGPPGPPPWQNLLPARLRFGVDSRKLCLRHHYRPKVSVASTSVPGRNQIWKTEASHSAGGVSRLPWLSAGWSILCLWISNTPFPVHLICRAARRQDSWPKMLQFIQFFSFLLP